MSRVVKPILVWPLALLGAAAAVALSASGLLSLVAAHASAPSPVHVKTTMPSPRLIVTRLPAAPVPQPKFTPSSTSAEMVAARTPMAQVGPAGATLRGAAGEGALAVWQLRPGSDVVVLGGRAGWSEVDQQGLVGWVPTSTLISD